MVSPLFIFSSIVVSLLGFPALESVLLAEVTRLAHIRDEFVSTDVNEFTIIFPRG